MRSAEQGGILEGLRVVELGERIAAPLAGLLLAEQGAEVVHATLTGREPADPVLPALLGRAKTEARLDPGLDRDRARLRGLLERADVVVESVGEAGLCQLGLDLAASRRTSSPGLIHVAIPAFPPADPRAGLPDHEALAGMAGFVYNKPLGGPRFHPFAMASVTAGLFAANGALAALIARTRSGRGQRVDTSLFHAALFAQVLQILVKTGIPRGFMPLKMVGSPFMRVWLCQDGRWVYLHVTLPAHNARMLELLERAGYGAEVARLRATQSRETAADPSQVKSIAEAKALKVIYERIFATRPAAAWEALLGDELCCIQVRNVDEWLDDSRAAGMRDACALEDPLLGPLLGPGPLLDCAGTSPRVEPRRTGAEALRELEARWTAGPSPHRPAAAVDPDDTRPPLAGVRVLDLSRVIAGPCAARLLAELGAEVLSVQSDTRLDWTLSFHLVFNAGKQSVTLDFRDDAGKRRLWALVDRFAPHALIQNYRHLDLARRIGVDPEAMAARYPGLAYTHLNAYGETGDWKDRPGFEQVVQAVTGIQHSYAADGRPRLLPSPIIDIGCGLLGALGTQLGLYRQRRSGQGAVTSTHLTSVAVLLQLDAIAAAQRPAARAAGLDVDGGREVLAGIVRMGREHVAVAGPRGDLARLLLAAGVRLDADAERTGCFGELARHLARRRRSTWQAHIDALGLGARVGLVPWGRIGRLVEDIQPLDPIAPPVVRRRAFPGSPRDLTFVAAPLRCDGTPLVEVAPPPERGADTAALLRAAGEAVADGCGRIPYPPDKPWPQFLLNVVRWGYFAWRAGQI